MSEVIELDLTEDEIQTVIGIYLDYILNPESKEILQESIALGGDHKEQVYGAIRNQALVYIITRGIELGVDKIKTAVDHADI